MCCVVAQILRTIDCRNVTPPPARATVAGSAIRPTTWRSQRAAHSRSEKTQNQDTRSAFVNQRSLPKTRCSYRLFRCPSRIIRLPPSEVMSLARHTDYRLTTGTYTDIRLIDTFGAVAGLPTYDEPEAQIAVRTGTDDRPAGRDQICDQIIRSNPRDVALSCCEADSDGSKGRKRSRRANRVSPYKNRGFVQTRGAKEKAGRAGPSTGLLGLEPRTF